MSMSKATCWECGHPHLDDGSCQMLSCGCVHFTKEPTILTAASSIVTDRDGHVWQFVGVASDGNGDGYARHCARCGRVEFYAREYGWKPSAGSQGDGYCAELEGGGA